MDFDRWVNLLPCLRSKVNTLKMNALPCKILGPEGAAFGHDGMALLLHSIKGLFYIALKKLNNNSEIVSAKLGICQCLESSNSSLFD